MDFGLVRLATAGHSLTTERHGDGHGQLLRAPSRAAANRATSAPTSTPSAWCSQAALPAACPSPARTPPRSSTSTSTPRQGAARAGFNIPPDYQAVGPQVHAEAGRRPLPLRRRSDRRPRPAGGRDSPGIALERPDLRRPAPPSSAAAPSCRRVRSRAVGGLVATWSPPRRSSAASAGTFCASRLPRRRSCRPRRASRPPQQPQVVVQPASDPQVAAM